MNSADFLKAVLAGQRVENSCADVLEDNMDPYRYESFLDLFEGEFEFDFDARDDEDQEWMDLFTPENLEVVPACAELSDALYEDQEENPTDLGQLFTLINKSLRDMLGIK
jgi:hypothetical protein